MRKGWLYATGLSCLMAACTGTPQSSADGLCSSIDVAGAMEKPAELKLSELGSDVCYVPLETTDSCLVGGSPNILLLDKEIVVFPHVAVLNLFSVLSGPSGRLPFLQPPKCQCIFQIP